MDSAERAAFGRSSVPRKGGDEQECAHYRLDDQVGFLLRRVTQRHVAIFTDKMGEDIQVIYPTVLSGAYSDRVETVVAMCRSYNHWLADYCAAYPDRVPAKLR